MERTSQDEGQDAPTAARNLAREEKQSDTAGKEAAPNQTKALEGTTANEQRDVSSKDAARDDFAILERLTEEEKRCDLYITAIHELNRRRERWGERRVQRIADDLGLNADQLKLTWCLLQAIEQTRQRPLFVRRRVEEAYVQFMNGGRVRRFSGPRERVCKSDVREATEALLAAGERVMEVRARVEAMLKRREAVLQIREDAAYEDDVLLSDEEDVTTLRGLCMKGIRQLPNTESIPEAEISSVPTRLATFAEKIRRSGDTVTESEVCEDASRMTKHRMEALRWVSNRDNYMKTRKQRSIMVEAVESICEEGGIQMHPVAKQAVIDCFQDEAALAEGGLHAFQGIVPGRFGEIVIARETRRLMRLMKRADAGIAETLVRRFGSARRSLHAGVDDVCEVGGVQAMEMLHGMDKGLHDVLRGRELVWLLCRVLHDRFGGVDGVRRAGFREFFDGWESVDVGVDEVVKAYLAIHKGSFGGDRERFEMSWSVFRRVCLLTTVEDCVGLTGALLNITLSNIQGSEDGLRGVCGRYGMDEDEADKLIGSWTNWILTSR